MLSTTNWIDYELIDAGDGERLERWGNYIFRRPDPQVIWTPLSNTPLWQSPHAHYIRSSSGGGDWTYYKKIPERWVISYNMLKFFVKPTGFKHMGLYPEQSVNWDWMMEKIKKANRPIRVLNAFSYTGGATLACAAAGAEVCHVDASKGVVTWAKENLQLSNLDDRPVRWIVDDVFKFVEREKRRGRAYDAIIIDPPTYGRGPDGEIWNIEKDLFAFMEACISIMSANPLFFIINTYVSRLSLTAINNLLQLTLGQKYSGHITTAEIGIPITASPIIVPSGVLGRWELE